MLRIHGILALLLVIALAGERSAYAQRAPDMATLDRGDGISKVGLDVGLSFVEIPYDLALRLELYGQYVSRSGLGIYGSLPLTLVRRAGRQRGSGPTRPDCQRRDVAE